jgi:hypothetical protein
MDAESQQSLVFVLKDSDRVGLAFFVDETHLLTCAHVVAACFDPPAGDLRDAVVDCEFLTGAEPQPFKARVKIYRGAIEWGVGTPSQQRQSDIAILTLLTPLDDLPLRPRPVRLLAPQTGSKVVLKGAVTNEDGMIKIATGEVTTLIEDGRYYVKIDPGELVRPGYSGGPVEVGDIDAVIGMVQKAPENGGDARFISAITIRDALASEFTLDVMTPPRKVDRSAGTRRVVDEGFVYELLKAKDRDDQEKQILESVKDATRAKRLVIALLVAPAESCPEIFRGRLADPVFARQPQWGKRTIWGVDWPQPTFSLGEPTAANAFVRELEALFQAAYAPRAPDVPDDRALLRLALVRRFALLPIKLRGGGAVRAGLGSLYDEMENWTRAHASAGGPPFCVLLILESPDRGGWLDRVLGRIAAPLEQQLADALASVSGADMVALKPLRPLVAARDLGPWITKSSPAIRRRGHEPVIIRNRVLAQTYDSDEACTISFYKWSIRLDQNASKIFAR